MLVLARFYGIVIKMYFLQSEHNPPHIHAIYNDDAAALDMANGNLLDGYLPARASSLVREWISQNQAQLLEMWNSQEFKAPNPLD